MNLAMYNPPSNLKSSLHQTWQTLLLFLKPLQIHNLKRKKWGTWHIIYPHLKKWGTRPRGHVPVSPTKLRPCNQSSLWSRLQTALAQIARIAPKWIYNVLKIFSPFTIFKQLALSLKKQSCPENFNCIEYTLYIQDFYQLVLALETEFPLKFFTVSNIFFTIHDFWATLCLAWKTG